ncbi:phenylacetate--CoA ligase family protein [Mycobacterium europaeum]|uniref:phenylacetate--CoA ligase family protein n=1 Tax=Mycobacterium europaeum TaxID=761804 RepID=UPI002AE02F73|nr:phenylacetate--CoA ligase family protein [Mycobacterium europaeum]MEA1162297.1 phenylacetate--CoA ligase family protein [Mycobacterium europaeum]
MRAKLQVIPAKLGLLKIAWEAWHFRRGDDKSISRRQQARLEDIVRHARIASPYYRNLYRHLEPGPVKLASLPIVTKRDLMAHFDDWVTDPAISLESLRRDFLADHSLVGARYLGRYHVATTSGTSGDPAILIHDDASWALFHFVGRRGELRFIARRDLLFGVLRRGVRAAALFVTDGHIGASAALESARRRSRFLAERARMFSVLRPVSELVAEINAFQPTVLEGYPSALALMASEQRAGRLTIRPLLAITSGEHLTATLRADIESTFGCPVQNRYASAECPGLSMECAHGLFHVNSDWYVLEPVDEDYRPVAPGVVSHTVLVTNLANRVQPLIRYDLGDRVKLTATPCACGNRLPGITVEGRTGDLLSFDAPDGTSVTVLPLALGTVVEETPGVRRFQVIRTSPLAVTVRLEMWPDADPVQVRHAVDQRLEAFFTTQGAAPVAVEHAPEPPAADPRTGKFRQVCSA